MFIHCNILIFKLSYKLYAIVKLEVYFIVTNKTLEKILIYNYF